MRCWPLALLFQWFLCRGAHIACEGHTAWTAGRAESGAVQVDEPRQMQQHKAAIQQLQDGQRLGLRFRFVDPRQLQLAQGSPHTADADAHANSASVH